LDALASRQEGMVITDCVLRSAEWREGNGCYISAFLFSRSSPPLGKVVMSAPAISGGPDEATAQRLMGDNA
jgi:hypothetical protein